MSSRLTVTVDATTLTEPFDVEWNEGLNRLGSFSFSLLNDDAQRSGIGLDDMVTISKDGVDVFYGVIESVRQVDTDSTEVGVTTYSGRSSVAELERIAVYPPLWPTTGVGQASGRNVAVSPWDTVRLFGWPDPQRATELLGTAGGSDDVASITTDRPVGWPDPQAKWIGDSGGASDVYFAGRIGDTDMIGSKLTIFVAFHGEGWLYHQGVLLLHVDAAEADPTVTHTVDVQVNPGVTQVFCARVRTAGTLSTNALFAFTAYDAENAELFFFKTNGAGGQDWGMFADPATPPGTTPGEVLLDILNEYTARRESLGWTFTFTGSLDSFGLPWPTIGILPVQVGETLPQVLERLAGAWIDFGIEVDAGIRTLSAWTADGVERPGGTGEGRGTASGVTLAVGTNVLELTHEVTA